ncbi:MAG TPA: DnaJ domain-containing protein [Bryobacteraceae bacterium]
MPPGIAQARLRVMESLEARPDLTVILNASGSPESRLQARFLGHSGDVMKIQLNTALGQGMRISVAGEVDTGTGRAPVLGQYRVSGCRIAGVGKYHAELELETPVAEAAPEPEPAAESRRETDDADYYELLQLSRNADTDTIHRVFHVLAQRYHPDNRETGNDRLFRQVVEAHAVLSHAERRAAYDVRLSSENRARLRIFDSLESTQGVQAEMRKRKGILRILYTRRLTEPHLPTMRVREFAEMLGCPIEHLEFSLWFLRESKFIVRSDNNLFEITVRGVEAFEAEEATYFKKAHLTLPAAAEATA